MGGNVVDSFVVIFRTTGCYWAKSGGCSMCGYSFDTALAVTTDDLMHQLGKAAALGEGKNLYDANKAVYSLLRYGFKVREGAGEQMKTVFLDDSTIRMRCRDHGVLSYRDAQLLCAIGPTARGSGVAMDVRHDYPYCAYGDLDVHPIIPPQEFGGPRGDVYDRIIVRLLELGQSIDIIQQCLDTMPAGEILWEKKLPKLLNTLKKAQGEAIGRVEAPRGECMHYVRMDGHEAPATWKVKASSYSNLMSWIPMLQGEQLADVPIIVASIDPCLSCTDRVSVIRDGGSPGYMTKEDLSRLSREKTRRLMQCR